MKNKSNNLFTLDKFIEESLYNKKSGYYMKKNPFGEKGDFITAPNSTKLNFVGQFNFSQKEITQIAIISENNMDMLGAVIKSPFSPKGFFFI